MGVIETRGMVTRGYRVASGAGGDPRFPGGTIAPQLPFFRDRIAGFDAWLEGPAFPGTINLTFAGCEVTLPEPDFVLPAVAWTPCFPPETFLLSRCMLVAGAVHHPAFAYRPDPATKPDHFQPAGILELLAAFVPGLAYGAEVTLRHKPGAIRIVPAG